MLAAKNRLGNSLDQLFLPVSVKQTAVLVYAEWPAISEEEKKYLDGISEPR